MISRSVMLRHLLALLALVTVLGGGASAQAPAPLVTTALAWKNLVLINGWAAFAGGTRNSAIAVDSDDIVYMRGAMALPTGNSTAPFKIPVAFRPDANVYVPVSLLNGNIGRLIIQKDGTVTIQTGGTITDADQFTSLDGVSYARK